MNIIKKERLIALAAVFAVLLTVYIVALYKLQIIEGEKYYEESRNNMVTTSTVTAARGNILDRNGRTLVTNKSSYDLTINTDELFPSDNSVDSNAVILKLVNMIRDYGDDYIDDLPITKSPPFEFENVSDQDQARLDAYMKQNKVKENASAVEILSSMRERYDMCRSARRVFADVGFFNVYTLDIVLAQRGYELHIRILDENVVGCIYEIAHVY